MVAALGGPKRLLDDPWQHLEQAQVQVPVLADMAGIVRQVDTRAVGMAVVALGGGRTRPQDSIDHAVGLTSLAAPGDAVGPERPLAIVHARNAKQAEQAAAMVRSAYRTTGRATTAKPVVIDRALGGRRPVLALGAEASDVAMLEYTTLANPLPAAAFFVPTGGNGETAKLRAEAKARGWTLVEPAADWAGDKR